MLGLEGRPWPQNKGIGFDGEMTKGPIDHVMTVNDLDMYMVCAKLTANSLA